MNDAPFGPRTSLPRDGNLMRSNEDVSRLDIAMLDAHVAQRGLGNSISDGTGEDNGFAQKLRRLYIGRLFI